MRVLQDLSLVTMRVPIVYVVSGFEAPPSTEQP